MKTNICILLLLLGLLTSCKKQTAVKLPGSYLEYLDEKQILGITATGNDVWVLSSTVCDTCSVPAYVSSIPLNYQLTEITGTDYKVDERTPVWKPVRDKNNNLYAKGINYKGIYRINGINDYSLMVETGDLMVNDFVFDNNNHIWIWGTTGIGYWNGSHLQVYNTSNSDLPTNIIHGIAVDINNTVWMPLDYAGKGILKIDNGNRSIMPITDIPGLGADNYLARPVADDAGNIWFSVDASASPKVVRYDGSNWETERPSNLTFIIGKDQKGTVWKTVNNSNTSREPTSLYYLKNNEWQQVSTGGSKGYIYNVDVTDQNIFIGTSRGLLVK
jgi:ligand-binding sensor domain-containing protein